MLEDLSIGKILLILLVVIVLFGPKKIPELAKGLGTGIKEFKRAMRGEIDDEKKPEEHKSIEDKKLD
jgi:sec-independent protein translocase protein TatA